MDWVVALMGVVDAKMANQFGFGESVCFQSWTKRHKYGENLSQDINKKVNPFVTFNGHLNTDWQKAEIQATYNVRGSYQNFETLRGKIKISQSLRV